MKCACCGDKIKGEPIWVEDDPYCCEECADAGPVEDEEIEIEDDVEEEGEEN